MKDLMSRLGFGSLPKICALSLLLTTPLSQIFADEARSVLEEVVVTAQKKEQSLMDAAIDVTAFSGEQLTVSGIDDVFGISKAIPGLTINLDFCSASPIILEAFVFASSILVVNSILACSIFC